MPARSRIPPPGARAVRRSTRRRATRSGTPTTPPPSSGSSEPGNIYTRIMNPTQAVLEERLATLEGGVAALAVASGQAGGDPHHPDLTDTGGHIVSSPSLYGGTYNLFHYTLPKLGIETTFVDDPDDLDAWAAAVRANTRAFLRRDHRQPQG